MLSAADGGGTGTEEGAGTVSNCCSWVLGTDFGRPGGAAVAGVSFMTFISRTYSQPHRHKHGIFMDLRHSTFILQLLYQSHEYTKHGIRKWHINDRIPITPHWIKFTVLNMVSENDIFKSALQNNFWDASLNTVFNKQLKPTRTKKTWKLIICS